MATAFSPGGQGSSSLTRTVEKTLEEAQYTGEVILYGRKLKEYPKVSNKYDLVDTIHTGEFVLAPQKFEILFLRFFVKFELRSHRFTAN